MGKETQYSRVKVAPVVAENLRCGLQRFQEKFLPTIGLLELGLTY
jgi:hypothetical protein